MMKKIGLFLIVILNISFTCYSQVLVKQKGDLILSLEESYTRAKEAYQLNDNVITLPTLRDYTSTLKIDYQLLKRVSVFAEAPFFKVVTMNKQIGNSSGNVLFEGDKNIGVSDPELGFRYSFFNSGKWLLRGVFFIGIPLGESKQENDILTGDGEVNQYLGADVYHFFNMLPAYLHFESGFNNRTKGFSDEFRYSAKFGFLFRKSDIGLSFRGHQTFYNGKYYKENGHLIGGSKGLFANNKAIHSIIPEINYGLTAHFSITGKAEFIYAGRNTLKAPTYTLGVFYKLGQKNEE